MPVTRKATVFGLALLALTSAQAQTLHFKVTGDYEARTIIAYLEDGGQATVKDKVVLEFDKDIKTGKVGPVKVGGNTSVTVAPDWPYQVPS